jgi:hypothetical protein
VFKSHEDLLSHELCLGSQKESRGMDHPFMRSTRTLRLVIHVTVRTKNNLNNLHYQIIMDVALPNRHRNKGSNVQLGLYTMR